MKMMALFGIRTQLLACENIRFSSLFAAGDVSRGFRRLLNYDHVIHL